MLRAVFAIVLVFVSGAALGDPLAATYKLHTRSGAQTQSAEFVLVRTDDTVEVQDPRDGVVERWERDPSGKIFYSRVFLEARKIIDYQPADFASANISDRWDEIRSVVAPDLRSKLEKKGQRRALGMRADRYVGNDAAKVTLDWIEDIALPARVQRRTPQLRSDLRLTRLLRGEDAAAQLVSDERLASFERIDFADLGDREGDPAIEKLVVQSGLELHTH